MGIGTGLHTWHVQAGDDPALLNPNRFRLEREAGIEPASLAWKAKVLPLNYSRPGDPAGASNAPALDFESSVLA